MRPKATPIICLARNGRRAMDKAFLRNIFSDPRLHQIGQRLWYGEIDGKKYGVVLATWNENFGNYALNCGEYNRTIEARHRNKIDEDFVVAAMKNGAGLLEYRGAVEAEKLQPRLAEKPIRKGRYGDFWTLEPFDLEDEDAPF